MVVVVVAVVVVVVVDKKKKKKETREEVCLARSSREWYQRPLKKKWRVRIARSSEEKRRQRPRNGKGRRAERPKEK